MSDENITISVDDSEIDAAIAKLDAALEKTDQLTGQAPEGTQESDFAAFYRNIDAQTTITKQNMDEVLEKGNAIKGLDSAASRIIRMIPGLREAQRIKNSLGAISEGSVMGVIGLLLVAYSIYRQVAAMLAEQERQRVEYRRMVMEARGFTLASEFERWKEDQTRIINEYRMRSPP